MGDPGIAVLLERLRWPDPLPAWREFLDEYSRILYQAASACTNDADAAADCYVAICEQLANNSFRRLRKFQPDGRASFSTWLWVVARNLCFDWHRKQKGRFRPFRSIQRLTRLELEIYMYRFERGLSPEQTLEQLLPTSPGLDLAQLSRLEKHVESSLSSRQRWLLSMRPQAASSAASTVLTEGDEADIYQIPDDRSDQEDLLSKQQEQTQIRRCIAALPRFERLLVKLRFEEDLSLVEIAGLTGLGDAQRVHRQITAALKKIRAALQSSREKNLTRVREIETEDAEGSSGDMNRNDQQSNYPEHIVEFSRQGWLCLRDDVVAAYLDGRLDESSRRKAESHLADCQVCRRLTADVIAMRRLDISELPLGLKERAFSTAFSRRNRRSVLVPAFAAAGIACAVLTLFLIERPLRLTLPLPRTPVAPAIAKSDLPPRQGDGNADIVRKLTQPDVTPTILFPAQNATVKRSQLRFGWSNVFRAQYYEIHLVTSKGDPVWESESKTNRVDLPADITLSEGAYFVWIDAVIDGQVKRSVPVRFLVRTSS